MHSAIDSVHAIQIIIKSTEAGSEAGNGKRCDQKKFKIKSHNF